MNKNKNKNHEFVCANISKGYIYFFFWLIAKLGQFFAPYGQEGEDYFFNVWSVQNDKFYQPLTWKVHYIFNHTFENHNYVY